MQARDEPIPHQTRLIATEPAYKTRKIKNQPADNMHKWMNHTDNRKSRYSLAAKRTGQEPNRRSTFESPIFTSPKQTRRKTEKIDRLRC
ncbi:unnamed protein product [Brassica napus]|uniref:(rape) hypothetical protein n=1 Tax=Brassica napus TaxID=3708 RepID=A0A816KGC9_BRANA|nr:unnamed protein product [Brassica napus]